MLAIDDQGLFVTTIVEPSGDARTRDARRRRPAADSPLDERDRR